MNASRETDQFGENLRLARKNNGLTQQELADLAKLDRATISLIENGKEQPRADTVVRLARVLNVSPAEFWVGEGERGSDVTERRAVHEAETLHYEPLYEAEIHPGLQELLADETMVLMLRMTPEEEQMLRSIRTRRDAPLGKQFFLDVLISYRRHHLDD